MQNNVWSHIEHMLAGAALVTVPLLLNGIPASWQNASIGAVIGLVWSICRSYLTEVTAQ